RVGGMGCVGRTVGVDHHLTVAMICNNYNCIVLFFGSFYHVFQAFVHGFTSYYRSLKNPGVAYHIGIGKIKTDKIGAMILDLRDDFISYFISTHFRFKVISGNFWRITHDPFLSFERLFPSTRKEKGDVGIFLGFGYSDLFFTYILQNFSKGSFDIVFSENRIDIGKSFII